MVFCRLLVLLAYVLVHGLGAGQVSALWQDGGQGAGCCVGQCCCIAVAPASATEDGCTLGGYVLSAAPCDGAAPGLPQQDRSGFAHLKPTGLLPVSFYPIPCADTLLAGNPTRSIDPIDKVPIPA